MKRRGPSLPDTFWRDGPRRSAGVAVAVAVSAVFTVSAALLSASALAGAAPAAGEPAVQEEAPALPHVSVDRERGHVEFEAEVIGDDADWLELLVCTAGGREHEALLKTLARPSHVHLGLLLLGLEPGQPAHLDATGAFQPAAGPHLSVTLHSVDGAFEPVPAGAWMIDREGAGSLETSAWLFAGSRLIEQEQGNAAFLADANGTLISLVSFGDDLVLLDLARKKTLGPGDDNQRFAASQAAPPAGTRVRVRLAPVPPRGAFDIAPAPADTPTSPPEPIPASPQDAAS